jgi:predicted peptidase
VGRGNTMNFGVNPYYLNKMRFFAVISFLFLFSCISVGFDDAGLFYSGTGAFRIEDNNVYRYLLYLPKNYGKEPSRRYPLLVYLHGKSCRGYNLEKLKRYGPPYLISKGWNFPFIIVSPQCPPDRIWDTDDWFPWLYRSLSNKYRIDERRIYLTGMSMGGSGVWALAIKHPEYFAAAIPLCGGWSVKDVKQMKDIPVWAFHGKNDKIVPPEETEKMVDVLRKVGGRVRYSKLKGEGHSIHRVYEHKKIYEWLLGHRKQ